MRKTDKKEPAGRFLRPAGFKHDLFGAGKETLTPGLFHGKEAL